MRDAWLRGALIALSASILNSAFYNVYFHWFVFIFLIPLFEAILYVPTVTAVHGFIWGICFYSFHWLGLWYFIIEQGKGLGSLLCCAFLLLYSALTAMGWFWLGNFFATRQQSLTKKMVVWCLSTLLFFIWARHGMFIIFGHWFGDPFAMPLLPLMSFPQWLYYLPILGSTILLSCLIFFSATLVCAYRERSARWLLIASLFFLPFIGGWFCAPRMIQRSVCTDSMRAVPIEDVLNRYAHDCGVYLHDCIVKAVETFPNRSELIMFLSESAFPFLINDHDFFIELAQCSDYCDDAWIVIGLHRKNGDKIHNSLCVVHNNAISCDYDKTFLMPFTEYIPYPWSVIAGIERIFLAEKDIFAPSDKEMQSITVAGQELYPFICADFFIGNHHNSLKPGIPFLCILNDHWLGNSAMRSWMLQVACYYALEAGREIIYITPRGGSYIAATGDIQEL